MLSLTLLTITLVSSQSLEIEVNHTVEEYLSQLNLAPTQIAVVVTDQVPEGAAVLYRIDPSGEDTAVFFFERGLLLELSEQERRVLIGHEVAHLAPECQPLWARIYREICADLVSLKLVPVDDVEAMLYKSIRMFPYYPAQQEFVFRLAAIQGNRRVSDEAEPTISRSSGSQPEDDWMDCA
jgi:sulfur carrier protein ThiS